MDSSVGIVATSWVDSRWGTKFLSPSPMRPNRLRGPTILLFNVQRVLFPRGWSGQGVELTLHLYIVQRFKIDEALPPVLPMPSCYAQGLLGVVNSSWNVMADGDEREGEWRGNWRMEWVASTLHTTSERGVSSITTTDAHTSAASSRMNWRPRRFKWTRPFRRKTKSGFCTCAITFQLVTTLQYR